MLLTGITSFRTRFRFTSLTSNSSVTLSTWNLRSTTYYLHKRIWNYLHLIHLSFGDSFVPQVFGCWIKIIQNAFSFTNFLLFWFSVWCKIIHGFHLELNYSLAMLGVINFSMSWARRYIIRRMICAQHRRHLVLPSMIWNRNLLNDVVSAGEFPVGIMLAIRAILFRKN